mmetsp:Transcript_18412/g.62059  ORF Transcript_18412/g.62059 Transcript_18412/m.62059 type:complete len:203 (-) Transcript_18412:228-836(-)
MLIAEIKVELVARGQFGLRRPRGPRRRLRQLRHLRRGAAHLHDRHRALGLAGLKVAEEVVDGHPAEAALVNTVNDHRLVVDELVRRRGQRAADRRQDRVARRRRRHAQARRRLEEDGRRRALRLGHLFIHKLEHGREARPGGGGVGGEAREARLDLERVVRGVDLHSRVVPAEAAREFAPLEDVRAAARRAGVDDDDVLPGL